MPKTKMDIEFEKKVQEGINQRNAASKKEAEMLKNYDAIAPEEQQFFGGEKWVPKDILKRKEFLRKYEK